MSSSAAAAKSLQSCPTLCDPIDSSPPGSPIPGILQARILEWVAISFSNAWKWKVKVKSFSRAQPLAILWTAAFQAPLSTGFSRQEYWSGVPLPPLKKCLSSVQFIRSVVSNSLQPHESQHTRPPCPSPSSGVHSDSRPSSQWCHPAISSSVVPFSWLYIIFYQCSENDKLTIIFPKRFMEKSSEGRILGKIIITNILYS